MKNTKVLYWVFTILFVGFMVFSSIGDVLKTKEAMDFLASIGYPPYFAVFIGVLKLLGCIAILIPGFPRIREWAYAGLFFDLVGATYSCTAALGFNPFMFVMLVPFTLLFLSYTLAHKLDARKAAARNGRI